MINYDVISTGSKGNAVVINGTVLIDCGVPFSALRGVYKSLQLVLLSHRHSDHFNVRTIRKLAQERPTLRWGIPDWLARDMLELAEPKNIDVYGMGHTYSYPDKLSVKPFHLKHDIENCGYSLCFPGEMMLYATDTNSLDAVEAKNYDMYMIEANYTEAEIIERIRGKQEAGVFCHEWAVLQNHLSYEKAMDFIYRNIGANGKYVLLHQHDHVGEGALA